MITIWKSVLGSVPYALPTMGSVVLPMGATPRHVGIQAGSICLWSVVDDQASQVPRQFGLVGTGQPCPPFGHVGTILVNGGWVIHVFLEPEKPPEDAKDATNDRGALSSKPVGEGGVQRGEGGVSKEEGR